MPARILVVEDDRLVLRDLQQQLARVGHIVAGATSSGEEAVRIAVAERPDLILMDIRLEGDLDGIDAAVAIRDACRIPIVFLTAYADEDTVSRATHAEPFGYLLKPFEDLQLATTIEIAIYKHAADAKLRQSERRYAATLSSIGDAVIATDDKALINFMNPVAEALTGWSQADALHRPLPEVFRIVNEDTRETVEDPAAKVLRLGTIVGLANHTVLIAKDGREYPIDDSGSPIVDDAGVVVGTVLVFRDISDKHALDETLRRAQAEFARVSRLTTMGELAASIAHEVNQPLMGIVTNAGTCIRYLEEARKAAERIVSDGHRAGDVIRSIRNLTSKAPAELRTLDVDEVISDVLNLLRSEFRRNGITIETSIDAGAAEVTGDPTQLQQVFLNLLMNAMEAVTDVSPASRRIRISTSLSGPDLVVSVEDEGTGFESATAERLFEPFYTSKVGGMGLGLSISRSVIEAHGGRLWASRRDGTTTFSFSLPRPIGAP